MQTHPALSPPLRRPRQLRAVRTDERILDTALEILAGSGWSSLSAQRVADDLGLSGPTVLARYRSASEIAAALWTQRLGAPLVALLESVIDACPGPGQPATGAALWQALRPFLRLDASLRATVELLIVGRYDEKVSSAVSATLRPELDRWLPADRPAQAARHLQLLMIAVGMLTLDRIFPGTADLDLRAQCDLVIAALAVDRAPLELPTVSAVHLDDPPVFDTDDPILATLLAATLTEVGQRGYEAATLQRIARTSGYSAGVIHHRYSSKRELFIDASARMALNAAKLNYAYQQALTRITAPGIADACLNREFMRPERREVRTVTYEQIRLSWHDPELFATIASAVEKASVSNSESLQSDGAPASRPADDYIAWARGHGGGIIADLHPSAWALPHDVVTVPLLEAVVTRTPD